MGSSISSISKNSKLRNNNNNNNNKVLPVRRSLNWDNWDNWNNFLDVDTDDIDIGGWFSEITGNDNGDGWDWEVLLNNNFNLGGGGGVLDMLGGIDVIDWDSMRKTLVEILEEMLGDGNFVNLPDGLDWETIANSPGGDNIDWLSIFDDIDLSSISVDWQSLLQDFDLSDLVGEDFDFENILSIDWKESTAWKTLLMDVLDGIDMSDIDINWTDVNACEIIQLVNGIGPNFGVKGNCTCDGNLATGLEIGCGFSGCAFGDDEGCGEVSLDLSLAQDDDAGAGLVEFTTCTKFNENFEEACIFYSVDMSNEGQPVQICSASYGDSACQCSIDASLCVTVDCSAIRNDAVMEQCMPMGMMRNKDDFDRFVPAFKMLAQTAEEEQEEKPKSNKAKFKMNGKNKKGKRRTCKYVKNKIKNMSQEKGNKFCQKPTNKKKQNIVQTVAQFCPTECA